MQQLRDRSSRNRTGQDILTFPGEDRYENARRAFNLAADQRPDVVALPRNALDVTDALRLSVDSGLRVAPQRTGHGATVLPPLKGALLLRTDLMRELEIDLRRRRARVGAGMRWQDIVRRLSPHGLAALHGSAPDVGIVGYTLGGGLSWYARRHGLAAHHVTAIELVTADGRWHRVDHDKDPELFWALRGGGGSFGVVTALEFALVPVPELYAGALFFEWERSQEILHAWRAWVADVPDELTSVGRILRFPPLPEIAEPLRGNGFVLVEAAYLGSEADGAELLAPLRRLRPRLDTFSDAAPADIAQLHMDPPEPVAGDGGGQLLSSLPACALDDIVDLVGPGSDSPLLSFELRHLGGALARQDPEHGVLGALPAAFASFAAGITPDGAVAAAVRERLDAVAGALGPYAGAYAFPNFTLHAQDPSRFFDEPSLARLRQVRARTDPDGLFIAKHAV